MKISASLLAVIIFTSVNTTIAQQDNGKYLDSLKKTAFKANADSAAVKAFSAIQRHFFNIGQYDSALKYAALSIPVAEKNKDSRSISRIYYNNGLIYTNLTRYDSAFYYTDTASKISLRIKDTLLLINCLNAKALLCNYQSDYSEAINYLMQAVKILETPGAKGFSTFLSQVYGNIGHNLIAENQIERGIAYEKKALLIKGNPDEDRYRIMLHLDIADAYLKLNKYPMAKAHLDTAVQLNGLINNIQVAILVANTQGAYYDAVNDFVNSLDAFMLSYRLADSSKNEYLKSDAGNNLSKIHLKNNNLILAEKFALESNALALKYQNLKTAASTYGTLKEIAKKRKNFEQALDFAELHKLYTDSATNTETQKTILYLESKYQNEKKEKDIADLKVVNTEQQLAVIKRNRLLLFGGISAVALLLILGLLVRSNRQKRLLAEKEKEVQQQQIQFLEKQQQVVSMQSMINGQETERTRIAKDLHDGLGGLFSTIKMNFSSLQHENEGLKTNPLFSKSYEMVDTASEEVRRIAHNMMPEVLIKLGLVQATKELCNSISAGKLLQASLQAYGMDKRLNASTEIMLFRIIQELLNNIIKHANATEAIVQFNREGSRLSVTVEDNGRGFNLRESDEGNHAGLESVQSRVTYLNGKISIESEKEVGTTVMMDFLIND